MSEKSLMRQEWQMSNDKKVSAVLRSLVKFGGARCVATKVASSWWRNQSASEAMGQSGEVDVAVWGHGIT